MYKLERRPEYEPFIIFFFRKNNKWFQHRWRRKELKQTVKWKIVFVPTDCFQFVKKNTKAPQWYPHNLIEGWKQEY